MWRFGTFSAMPSRCGARTRPCAAAVSAFCAPNAGERLLVYAREHGGERLTVAINAGEESVQLPEAPANVLWGEGLEDAALAAYSFVMYVG